MPITDMQSGRLAVTSKSSTAVVANRLDALDREAAHRHRRGDVLGRRGTSTKSRSQDTRIFAHAPPAPMPATSTNTHSVPLWLVIASLHIGNCSRKRRSFS